MDLPGVSNGHRLPWILASASPRRRELLSRLGHPFLCVVPAIEEWEPEEADPVQQVETNARNKALAVAGAYPQQLVIASDTTVALGRRLFAKPRDLRHAAVMLRELSGRTHQVVTGVALLRDGRERVFHDTSSVRFRVLDDSAIMHYLSTVPVLDKAGAYAVQQGGDLIIESFSGSFENIMGLPLDRLRQELVRLGEMVDVTAAESTGRGLAEPQGWSFRVKE